MTNPALAQAFSDLAKLMEYRGENAFKIRSYQNVADTIKKGDVDFAALPKPELLAVEGIGAAIADKIAELVNTGQLDLYRRYVEDTPAVALQLLTVKGLGAKKVRQLVAELQVGSVGELLQAVDENRVAGLKGWSGVSQAKLRAQLLFFQESQARLRYASALPLAEALLASLRPHTSRVEFTGQLRRQAITVDAIELLAIYSEPLRAALASQGFVEAFDAGYAIAQFRLLESVPPQLIYLTGEAAFEREWLTTTGSPEFLDDHAALRDTRETTETQIFAEANMPFVPAPQREPSSPYPPTPADKVIAIADIRGVVHAHTTASDGSATLDVLAKAVQAAGYTYLTITDHSRAAFYANGLTPERRRAQAAQIDAYNEQHPGFTVFKGTEVDILRDGTLDFADEILAELDIVIASVHSVLDMTPADATERLLRAIANPYVTMLGHPTGRLLLSREGYHPDMPAVLAACAEHAVAVEINASPMRLDLDWTYVPLAVELGVKISINPDAHSATGIENIRHGVLAAQKAGLRKGDCLNCLEADEFSAFLLSRKRARGILQ